MRAAHTLHPSMNASYSNLPFIGLENEAHKSNLKHAHRSINYTIQEISPRMQPWQTTSSLRIYSLGTYIVLLGLVYRIIYSGGNFWLENKINCSSFSRTGNLSLSHSMTENVQDRLEYLGDPFTHRILKRDAESRDFRSACFDFSVNSNKQVKCTPSFSVAGMPKGGTSALYFYLKQHPQLALMPKELCALDPPINAISSSLRKQYFDKLLPRERVCKDCLVGEGCISARDTSAYHFAIPSISTVFLLLRHPARHNYASYWFWCTPEEVSKKIGDCAPGRTKWNTRQNISYVDANNITQWHNFPR